MSHRWQAGPLSYYRRQKKEWEAAAEIFEGDRDQGLAVEAVAHRAPRQHERDAVALREVDLLRRLEGVLRLGALRVHGRRLAFGEPAEETAKEPALGAALPAAGGG